MGFPGGLDSKESACNVGDLGLIPGLGRSSGGGHGIPLQCSCLEVHGDAESATRATKHRAVAPERTTHGVFSSSLKYLLQSTCSLEENYDKPRQHIKKQRHYFADKGLSNQSYDFSSSYV